RDLVRWCSFLSLGDMDRRYRPPRDKEWAPMLAHRLGSSIARGRLARLQAARRQLRGPALERMRTKPWSRGQCAQTIPFLAPRAQCATAQIRMDDNDRNALTIAGQFRNGPATPLPTAN